MHVLVMLLEASVPLKHMPHGKLVTSRVKKAAEPVKLEGAHLLLQVFCMALQGQLAWRCLCRACMAALHDVMV
jgi:hypothetical protein